MCVCVFGSLSSFRVNLLKIIDVMVSVVTVLTESAIFVYLPVTHYIKGSDNPKCIIYLGDSVYKLKFN